MIADAFDDRCSARVAHREPLAGDAAEECLAAGRTVEDDVADEDAFLGQEAGGLRRVDDDAAAGESLADVVVRIAFEFKRDAVRDEGAKALSSRALEAVVDASVGQPSCAVAAGYLSAEHGADSTVHVANGEASGHWLQ